MCASQNNYLTQAQVCFDPDGKREDAQTITILCLYHAKKFPIFLQISVQISQFPDGRTCTSALSSLVKSKLAKLLSWRVSDLSSLVKDRLSPTRLERS